MPSLNQIRADQDFLTVFNDFMSTYQQLAAMKMQQIRDSIIQTRRYMDGLADVFVDVEQSHRAIIKRLLQEKRQANQVTLTFSTLPKNNKNAMVLVSPDTKFSSDVSKKVFDKFADTYDQNQDSDVIIVGVVGERFFEVKFPHHPYTSLHIPQALSGLGDLKELIELIIKYDRVDVFYARFFTLVKQEAVDTNITGNVSLSTGGATAARPERDFVFEPKIKTMLRFFELQIFTSLLKQTVNESYLANLGSRIVTLESATQNVKHQAKDLGFKYRQMERYLNSKKQHSQIAGIALWQE